MLPGDLQQCFLATAVLCPKTEGVNIPFDLEQVMNALAMEFEDDTFDLVWACESGEHMPDKRLYVEEMTRVLKPGASSGLLVPTSVCPVRAMLDSTTWTCGIAQQL